MHPTVKPVQMIADAIKDVSGRWDIVLDLFGGSGSTLIAAEKTGRRARLMEFDPNYCVNKAKNGSKTDKQPPDDVSVSGRGGPKRPYID